MTVTERIVAQATEMFIHTGIRAITVDDISKEAGVSKRTIYENFKDKNELLRACLMHVDRLHEKESGEIISGSKNTIDLVFKSLKHGVKAISSINPVFFTDLKKYHFRIWKETYEINHQKYLAQTSVILKKGINEGLIRKEIDIDIVVRLLNEHLKIMSDEQVFPSDRFSKTAVFEHIVINFVRGIATAKGLEMIEKCIHDYRSAQVM